MRARADCGAIRIKHSYTLQDDGYAVVSRGKRIATVACDRRNVADEIHALGRGIGAVWRGGAWCVQLRTLARHYRNRISRQRSEHLEMVDGGDPGQWDHPPST